jgi:hypothetical protein
MKYLGSNITTCTRVIFSFIVLIYDPEKYLFRSGDMSEEVKFVVYYGSGNVQETESGADLSEFEHVEMQLADPDKAHIRWFQYYLLVNFRLDPEVWTVRIQFLWTKHPEHIFWELFPIDRNHQWLGWLASCKSRGTHPVALISFVQKQQNLVQGGGGYGAGQVVRRPRVTPLQTTMPPPTNQPGSSLWQKPSPYQPGCLS